MCVFVVSVFGALSRPATFFDPGGWSTKTPSAEPHLTPRVALRTLVAGDDHFLGPPVIPFTDFWGRVPLLK